MSLVVIKFKNMKINEILGSFIRGYREERGYTLEQIATASHRYGTGWSAATILSMQKGGSKVDALPNVLILVQTFNDLSDDDSDESYVRKRLTIGDVLTLGYEFLGGNYGLLDLYEDEDGLDPIKHPENFIPGDASDAVIQTENTLVYLTDDCGVQVDALDSAFNYVDVNLPEWEETFTEELFNETDAEDERISRLGKVIASHYGKDWRDLVRSVTGFGCGHTASEERASKKLGLYDTRYFSAICLAKYGRRLNDEVAARVGDGANQQKRGRMTRKIVAEVRETLEKAEHGEL